VNPTYLAAGQMASMYAIEFAIAKANSTDPESLRQALTSLYLYFTHTHSHHPTFIFGH
jgi:hypothetical protein